MERWSALRLNSTSLPPGMRVGTWELGDWRGHGTYGTVYSAVRVGDEEAGLVALKMANHPEDPRYGREVELLSRIRHPNVPRLLGQGHWRSPSGANYPYFVMEWVEGLPLYTWASALNPPTEQVRRVLAQLARALEATHAVGGVHRDVKGANVLVRLEDGWPFLTDFGAGHYTGATTLTQEALPPGTPVYRSPEARRYAQQFEGRSAAPYAFQPADDVFALGVMAYRMVVREYPPLVTCGGEKSFEDHGQEEGGGCCTPQALKLEMEPQLAALIQRMLSVDPKARGTAREVAEAFEQAAEDTAREASQPVVEEEGHEVNGCVEKESSEPRVPVHPADQRSLERWSVSEASTSALRDTPGCHEAGGRAASDAPSMPLVGHGSNWRWAGLLGGALLGALVVLLTMEWPWCQWQQRMEPTGLRPPSGEKGADGGTAALGSAALTAPIAMAYSPTGQELFGLPLPKEPLAGQRRTPQCKLPLEESINGGCWIRLGNVKPPCEENGYEWKGNCYLPSYSRPPQPASEKE